MLRLTIVLCIATAVVYGATQLVSKRYGDKVRARFLERNPTYTAESLSTWVQSNPQAAAGYAFPVLFPLDLLFMAFLAAFLTVASFGLAGTVDRLAGVAWLFVLLPILYLAVDLAEDTMLRRFLLSP